MSDSKYYLEIEGFYKSGSLKIDLVDIIVSQKMEYATSYGKYQSKSGPIQDKVEHQTQGARVRVVRAPDKYSAQLLDHMANEKVFPKISYKEDWRRSDGVLFRQIIYSFSEAVITEIVRHGTVAKGGVKETIAFSFKRELGSPWGSGWAEIGK